MDTQRASSCGKVKIGYAFTYLYLSLCPFTGQGFAAFLPALDGANFGWFVEQLQGCMQQPSLLIADGATAHQSSLFDTTKLVLSKLPAACPELNPAEHFFKEVGRQLKSRGLTTLEAAQEAVQLAVKKVSETAEKVISLTCFPYIRNTSI
jgi:transposase